MDNGEAIRARIRELMKEHNMTEYRLIRKAGMPPSTLKSILNGKAKDPRTGTIMLICNGFHITVREFYSSELFEDSSSMPKNSGGKIRKVDGK